MAQTFIRLPVVPQDQKFKIVLNGVTYNVRLTYNDAEEGGWTLDLGDAAGTILLAGKPLVTGADLLAQHQHLGFNGSLFVTTDRDTGEIPTQAGLGVTSQLTFVSVD